MTTIKDILATPCRISSYAKDKDGYCKITINGKKVLQHRVTYCAAHNLKLPDITNLNIVQMCGRHNCMNPMHLTAVKKLGLVYKLLN